jgi:hypothetical protein
MPARAPALPGKTDIFMRYRVRHQAHEGLLPKNQYADLYQFLFSSCAMVVKLKFKRFRAMIELAAGKEREVEFL